MPKALVMLWSPTAITSSQRLGEPSSSDLHAASVTTERLPRSLKSSVATADCPSALHEAILAEAPQLSRTAVERHVGVANSEASQVSSTSPHPPSSSQSPRRCSSGPKRPSLTHSSAQIALNLALQVLRAVLCTSQSLYLTYALERCGGRCGSADTH